MFERFDFDTPVAALKSYNALPVPAEYFPEAMERLRERYLNVPLEAVLHPASASARQSAQDQQAAAAAAPAVKVTALTAQEWFERGLEADGLDEKLRCYTQAILLNPEDEASFNNRGIAHYGQGNLDAALADYNEAIRLNPEYAAAFNNRGNVRAAQGDEEGALEDYREARRLEPDFPEAFLNFWKLIDKERRPDPEP
jgi:tetratricopeptide (TPR) repeat protein